MTTRWIRPQAPVWVVLPAVGAVLCALPGPAGPWARLLGGVLVAAGIAVPVAVLARAWRQGRLATAWVRLSRAEVLAVALGAWYLANRPDDPVPVLLATVLLAAGLWWGRRLPAAGRSTPYVAHLPGAPATHPEVPRRPFGWWSAGFGAVLVLGFLAGLAQLPGLVLLGVVVVGLAAMALVAVPLRRHARAGAQVRRAIAALAPVYVLPYNGSARFHVGMWSPYVERAGRPYVVVTTDRNTFEGLAATYTMPVLCPADSSPQSVTAVLPSSLRAAFYVHNGGNAVFLSRHRLTHVFLHHGDGDKAASSNPVSSRYDVLVVAGQAAIDRYAARGVEIAPEKFAILGRPQTEDIRTVSRPIAEVAAPVVLYAPTWRGKDEEQNYSSLHLGPQLVEALLERGATVIFRPHPAGRSHPPHKAAIATIRQRLAEDAEETGRRHVWGRQAETDWTVADVSNRADAMIADVSGIVTDFMQTLKPFAMVATKSDPDTFRDRYPTSRSAYVISGDLADLRPVLAQMLGPDPLAPVRAERRRYYLGGYDGDGSARAFVDYVRSLAD